MIVVERLWDGGGRRRWSSTSAAAALDSSAAVSSRRFFVGRVDFFFNCGPKRLYGIGRWMPRNSGPQWRHFCSGLGKNRINNLHASVEESREEQVVIAIGGNVGDRASNFSRALKLMRSSGLRIKKHSCLYETVPMHVTEQPLFLNSAVAATTSLDPESLLRVLKGIEAQLGRSSEGIKYGPRPIDLDIIFYGEVDFKSQLLEIPHSMFRERPFVLAPVVDLLGGEQERSSSGRSRFWSRVEENVAEHWQRFGGEGCIKAQGMRRVLPIKHRLLEWSQRTYVMGILNLTPDSFTDGGRYMSLDSALAHFEKMVSEGADFIDIGAQSTRPNASRLTTEEELQRLAPVLKALTDLPSRDKVLVSVDTFDSVVAREAVALGADMINDVSAGKLDERMLATIAELEAPCVLMHMRGDPTTMQKSINLKYDDVAEDVARELCSRVEQAEAAGIPAWSIVTDPGFGFSKTIQQNVLLLKELPRFREALARRWSNALTRGPLLAGLSRKSFLGKLCGGVERGEDRDYASAAAFAASVLGGANILRAHNVAAARQAAMVADAVKLAEPSPQSLSQSQSFSQQKDAATAVSSLADKFADRRNLSKA